MAGWLGGGVDDDERGVDQTSEVLEAIAGAGALRQATSDPMTWQAASRSKSPGNAASQRKAAWSSWVKRA